MALIGWQPCPVAGQDESHFFETHVRPVLVEKCIGCHGDQKQSGGLRLDSRDAMLKGGDSGAALIPGDVSASHMIQAIRYDGDLQMPPKNELSDAEKQALIQWVESGAVWPQNVAPLKCHPRIWRKRTGHFNQVTRPEVPAIAAADAARIRTPIDAFILAKLNEASLTLSAEADRRTLIRRVLYTLTGLPPTAEDVEDFLNDSRPAWPTKTWWTDCWPHRRMASTGHATGWILHGIRTPRATCTRGRNDSGFMHGRIATGLSMH